MASKKQSKALPQLDMFAGIAPISVELEANATSQPAQEIPLVACEKAAPKSAPKYCFPNAEIAQRQAERANRFFQKTQSAIQ